ncbi:ERF family protein [Paenibacillus chitinolyticus]
MSEKTLVKKLAEVMQQVKYIQKTGLNKFHNYKYATEADVNEKVREELSQRNIILIPNTKGHSVREHTTSKGNREYIVTVEVEFTFMDGDSGESISFTTFGEGQDPGDKGTYKAITGAQKYALMKSFMIPTGDDPEADSSVDERNQESPPNPSQQPQNSQGPYPVIKAKYQTWKGNENGFDLWYSSQSQKYNDRQIEHWLTQQIMKNKGA